MSFYNNIIRIFASIEPAVPQVIVCFAATAVALIALMTFGDMIWINQKRFKLYGIFYGLSTYDCLRLAVSWIRLILTISIVAMFRELATIHYIVYAIEGIIFVCDIKRPSRIFINLVWFILQFLGIVATSLLCDYIKSMMYVSVSIWVIYIFLSLFLVIFSIFIFLNEIDQVSQDRVLLFDNKETGVNDGRKQTEQLSELKAEEN